MPKILIHIILLQISKSTHPIACLEMNWLRGSLTY